MKLISCHIVNFGKLSDKTIDFSEGVNTLTEKNGWGKSTLAAFIRAMFYGVETSRSKTDERREYRPWQGGVYGGSLTFNADGVDYTVTRTFGAKEAEDVFELREASSNLISDRFTKDLGVELFDLDRDSFSRTAFIGQSDCGTKTTDNINVKVGNLTDAAEDMGGYEGAIATLNSITNNLSPTRKTGSIKKRAADITEQERLIRDGAGIQGSMDLIQESINDTSVKLERLKNGLDEVKKDRAVVNRIEAARVAQDTLAEKKEAAARTKEALSTGLLFFKGDVPERDEIDSCLESCSVIYSAKAKAQEFALSDEDLENLKVLDAKYASGIPLKEDIDKKLQDTKEMLELIKEEDITKMPPSDEARLKELSDTYVNDDWDVESLSSKWGQRGEIKRRLTEKENKLEELIKSKENRHKALKSKALLFGILAAAAVLIMIAGILLSVLKVLAPTIGFAIMMVGGVLLIIAGIGLIATGVKSRQKAEDLEENILSCEIDDDRMRISQTDGEIHECLQAHGMTFDEYNVPMKLSQIAGEQREYRHLEAKAKDAAAGNHQGRISEIRGKVSSFLEKYGVFAEDGRFQEELFRLNNESTVYKNLCDKRRSHTQAMQEMDDAQKEVLDFLEKYSFEPTDNLRKQVDEIREHAESIRTIKAQAENAERELEEFYKKHDEEHLKVDLSKEYPTISELEAKEKDYERDIELCRQAIRDYNLQLDDLNAKNEELDISRDKLAELKELQISEKNKYECVELTAKYLTKAKENMTARYTAPIMNHFNEYFELISSESAQACHMDANSNITVDEQGMQRELDRLSAGYKDLIGVSLRVALVDAMYSEERPVLVMDDPFTNLDDEKLETAKRFLNKIGEKYQVVYFTCSKSRA